MSLKPWMFAVLAVTVATSAGCKKKKKEPAGGGAEGGGSGPAADAATAAQAPDPAVVARGQYLVMAVANCGGCHNPLTEKGPDMSRMLAGGNEFQEVFGKVRMSNITPDKKTGIGDWTIEQIVAGIRQGKRPNGEQMYPFMPYLRFQVLSDADATAVATFLKTLPPIENAVVGNTDLKLPKIPVEKPAATGEGADEMSKGMYYLNLMQCGDCHTPMGPEGPDMSKEYSGGMEWDITPDMGLMAMIGTGKLVSPNITPDEKTGIGKYTEEQIVSLLKTGVKKDGKMLMGPMLFFIPAWAHMKDEDLKAVAKALKGLKPIPNAVAKSNFKPNLALEGMVKGALGGGHGGPPPGGPPPGGPPPGAPPAGGEAPPVPPG